MEFDARLVSEEKHGYLLLWQLFCVLFCVFAAVLLLFAEEKEKQASLMICGLSFGDEPYTTCAVLFSWSFG